MEDAGSHWLKSNRKLKNLVEEDGRNFSMKSNFAFQRISLDTQVYFLMTSKAFDFNRLFAMITDNMSVEKNKNAFSIPFDESPKILLSTNFVIKEDETVLQIVNLKIELRSLQHKFKSMDEFGKRFLLSGMIRSGIVFIISC
ncbi:MAG: hypothetical protein IPL53_08470 [Ignavibacteria bacterium]|nr:hypothetical protein [Ignavibacteria bacterium]